MFFCAVSFGTGLVVLAFELFQTRIYLGVF